MVFLRAVTMEYRLILYRTDIVVISNTPRQLGLGVEIKIRTSLEGPLVARLCA